MSWQKNKAKGMCGKCGKQPPIPGKTLCVECLDGMKFSQRKYRAVHREEIMKRTSERYWERRNAGLCVTCGRTPHEPDRMKCKECNEKNVRAVIECRKRKAAKKNVCKEC